MVYKKVCSVCNKAFETRYSRQNICCFPCQQIALRERSRELMKEKRKVVQSRQLSMKERKKVLRSRRKCVICDYQETTDLHHDGQEIYILCPNHHALITRNIKTIDQLFEEKLTGRSQIIHSLLTSVKSLYFRYLRLFQPKHYSTLILPKSLQIKDLQLPSRAPTRRRIIRF